MFRYDRPQAGRYRQFHQFGVESLGSSSAAADAEVILLAVQFLKSLGLNELKLNINSVGCPKCRPVYRKKLQDFLADKKDGLCEDCKSRFAKNPLRILDCKNEHCQEVSSGAPEMADCLCEECHDHFEQLKTLLGAAGVEYTLNPRLVRGLDYYTKTAFEIQYAPLGAQSAVCGGGRYDGLVAECGGPVTPAVGFAAGLERVLLALEKQNLLPKETAEIDAAVISLGDKAQGAAFSILCDLRKNSLTAEMDFGGRSLKAQMKQANKSGAKYAVIIGEDEINAGEAVIKNMENGEQEKAAIKDIVNKLTNLLTEVIN
jgi:histidyl-tRNA synthetase